MLERTLKMVSSGRAKLQGTNLTADIPLAARCLKVGARVLGPNGQIFAEESIGDLLATRDLMEQLRQAGVQGGGPPPFGPADRSRFLSRLGEVVHSLGTIARNEKPPR